MIHVLALDLERTLISDAMNREPRPGLYDFLLFCCQNFPRIALFTSVSQPHASAALQELEQQGYIPPEFLARVEYVVWEGKYKDLRFIPNAEIAEILLIDDDGGWLLPEQRVRWLPIAEYDPYLVQGEDTEFERLQKELSTNYTKEHELKTRRTE